MSKALDCFCGLCTGQGDPHPIWGYDRSKVTAIKCMSCQQPIGSEPYIEDLMFARFGTVSFYHRRCIGTNLAKMERQNERQTVRFAALCEQDRQDEQARLEQ